MPLPQRMLHPMTMAPADVSLLGIGLYTATQASQLARIPVARLRRWLVGSISNADRTASVGPIWSPEVPPINGALHVSFRDLIEVRVLNRLRSVGLSLQQLRKAHDLAQEILAEERPFSAASFRTDGKRVYLEIAKRSGEPGLVDLLTKQHSFHSVVLPSLRSVDFEDGGAARWWPASGGRSVVLDPKRSFGRPIIASSGVPTDVLADAYVAEGSFSRAAAMFGVSKADVKAALRFQQNIAA